MTLGDRLRYGGLLLLSVVLAVVELFFLPLRLDGRVLPNLASIPFPVTVLLAAFTMPWLVVAASRFSLRTAVAAGPLFAWLGTLLAFLLVAPGGDRIVLADWRTLLLLAAGAFPAAVKIGDVLAKATLERSKGNNRG
ncbi:hypothetical protein SAMN05192558_10857 [Actinokineospora alba]|uniref:Uncharacterized protein n=1 Tax=Actinokineospora alba TaxID=504798 RepID=A0A1H0RNW8_9PSEU|nr:hypothetical protein [Actinokineospora alba]TDP66983.1 hypothetical protein C8E96_2502 [Actinokineospora alba]SDJ32405.1 hypothetical protein SAMN05421871_11357 [Actinokineospora alba]SDP31222.1 hypothetical protein SAMN05192558_10857 [Actinokineospora alba]